MLMEAVLALLLFAIVGTALMTALNEVGRMAFEARRESVLTRLLDSELRAAMTVPVLEEGETTKSLDELGAEIRSLVEPIEDMENQEGRLLQQMYRIEVVATWWEDDLRKELSAETWRYARLYQP
jgi:Na+-translocating ferredoxin:NAD+ oxidoreductase RnfG subunit